MTRHPSLVPLSHDHHHGLALALRCRKQALGQIRPMGVEGLRERAKEFHVFFSSNLVRHFRAEEEILFPLISSLVPESQAIIDRLLKDHDEIRAASNRLESERAAGKILFDLGDLLERHIRTEERELFPLFERHVGITEAEGAAEEIRKILAWVES
jgi:iron-sulfur cluster repair protein YtfE (RIC family)